jgi:hypothetical protein
MAWLGTYAYRYKIKIPAGTVTETQTDFPVALYFGLVSGINGLDTTFIFEVTDTNYKKIAITSSDGTTRLYGEVEKWDAANATGLIHIKIPNITTSDNYFYVYFDDEQADDTTYIGLAGSAAAANVWNSNFKCVYNFGSGSTTTATDSTSNNYTGTLTNVSVSDGLTGKAVYLNGTNASINVGNSNIPVILSAQFEFWVKMGPETAQGRFFSTKNTEPATIEDEESNGLGFVDNRYYAWNDFYAEAPAPNENVVKINEETQLYETWQHLIFTISNYYFYVDGVRTDMRIPNDEGFSISNFTVFPGKVIGIGTPRQIAMTAPLYPTQMDIQSFRMMSGSPAFSWNVASYKNMNDNLCTLDTVEFYQKEVLGIPFEILGDPGLSTYFKLLITHESYDDLFVPIESFQFRHTAGNEAYLSVSIPDFNYYDKIIERDGGKLKLYMLYGQDDVLTRNKMIAQVDLDAENISYDTGNSSKPITLDGYGVFGSRYLNLDLRHNTYKSYENENGTYRFRFPGHFYFLRTNDTVDVDGVEIVVNSISANRSVNNGQMELSDG